MVDLTKNKNFFILPLLLSLLILVSVKINFAIDKFTLNAERIKFNYFVYSFMNFFSEVRYALALERSSR